MLERSVRRRLLAVGAVGVVALCGGRVTAAPFAETPPSCSPRDVRSGAVIRSPGWESSSRPGFLRFCGSARVVIRVGERRVVLSGGSCSARRVRIGFEVNGVGSARSSRVFYVVLDHPTRPGRAKLIDGLIQVPGFGLAGASPLGIAVVAKDRGSATFTLNTGSDKVTGRWTCR